MAMTMKMTQKGSPTRILWYLSIISQFKCFFVNVNYALNPM